MTSSPTIQFAVGAVAAAAFGAVALAAWLATAGPLAVPWAAAGFVATAVPGIAGGAWLAREHGRPGSQFLIALVSGFVTRLVVAAFAAYFAAKAGGGAAAALLAGLGAGFVPLLAFETIWFAHSPGAQASGTRSRG